MFVQVNRQTVICSYQITVGDIRGLCKSHGSGGCKDLYCANKRNDWTIDWLHCTPRSHQVRRYWIGVGTKILWCGLVQCSVPRPAGIPPLELV